MQSISIALLLYTVLHVIQSAQREKLTIMKIEDTTIYFAYYEL